MVESYVGSELFRKGVASYIAAYAYKNAAGEDFWGEMARVTGRPIDRMIRSFVDQEGAPLLTIRQSCGGTSGDLAVTQSRLLAVPDKSSQPRTWTLPACLRTSDNKARCEVVDRPAQTFAVGGCDAVFANADARGYYVSDYTPENVRALAQRSSLSRMERLNLATDEWWMTVSARHQVGVFLDLVNAFATDDTPALLTALQTRVDYVAGNIVDDTQRPRLQQWIRERFGPVLTQLGLAGDPRDPDYVQGRRGALMSLVGVTGGDASVQRRARELATQYIANPVSVSATLAPTVLQIAAFAGDRALYDQYVAKLPKLTSQPEEYYMYFTALGWFADPALMQETLKWSLTPAVKSQDTGTLLRGMLRLPWAREATWKFVKDQWPALVAKLGEFQGIPGIVSGVSNLCSTADAADVRAFFAKHPADAVERRIQQSIESIEACASVRAHQSRPLALWLATSR
jgi:aminopeptidase N